MQAQKSLITLPPMEIETETIKALMSIAKQDDKAFGRLVAYILECSIASIGNDPEIIARFQEAIGV
jgi:hypothetical protein